MRPGFTMRRLRRALSALLVATVIGTLIQAGGRPAAAATLQDLIAPGATVQQIGSGFGFIEGPVWHRDGYLLFSDTPRNQILKWHPTAGLSTYNATIVGPNGLTFDSQNRLVVAEQNARKVERQELDGTIVTLAATYEGKKLNSPNDLAFNASGNLYFTDPPYGLPGGTTGKELTFNGVFRLSPSNVLTLLTTEFDRPNGIAFSPNERVLYVADTSRSVVRAFDVLADGMLANSRLFASVTGPDGLKVDEQGNVWVAGSGGVWVLDPTGARIGIISTPEGPANVAFGDSDFKTLYITARTGLYRIRLNVAGIRHYGAGGPPQPTSGPSSTATRTSTTGPSATPASCGASNVAQGKPATSSSNENAGTTPNLAVDGNTGTRWASAFSDPQWIRVDLGATTSICRVQLLWEAAYGRSYQIQTSNDGAAWTTIYSTTAGDGGTDNLVNLAGSARYVRMNGTARATAYGYSLWELQVYAGAAPVTPTRTNTAPPTATRTNTAPPVVSGTPTSTRTVTTPPTATRTNTAPPVVSGTPTSTRTATTPPTATRTSTTPPTPTTGTTCGTINVARGKPATSSSNENAGTTANLAVDGNTGTRWSSAFSDPQWIRVDLGATVPICRVLLRWEAAYATAYRIETSNDGTTWTVVRSLTAQNGGIDDNTGLNASGRYVRIYGTTRATAYGYSLWELEVY